MGTNGAPRSPRRRSPVLVVLIALAGTALAGTLAGCGGGNDATDATSTHPNASGSAAPDGTATASASPSPASPSAPVSSTPPSSAAPTDTTVDTTPATTPATKPATKPARVNRNLSRYSLAGLKSPSGNIACLFTDDPVSARCDLKDAHWAVPTPSTCNLDYGDSAYLARGKAELGCHGDTVFGAPHQAVLPYGESVRFHTIVCTSQTTGVTCTDTAGHGFTVSEQAYQLH